MVYQEILDNGLAVLIEEMPHFESAAIDLMIPGGLVIDSDGAEGAGLILTELTERGAGGLDSRALSNAYESKGIRHSSATTADRYLYRNLQLSDKLEEAIRLTALTVLSPQLPKSEIDPIRNILLQELSLLEDSPARKVGVEIGKRYYPAPYGRSSFGTEEGLNKVSHALLSDMWSTTFRPDGAVLSVAGNVKREEVLKIVKTQFSNWKGKGVERPPFGTMPQHAHSHIESQTAQVQIAIAFPSAKFEHPHYYTAKVVNEILSGGMFGRLFIEVREKRGLCYSVNSRHAGGFFVGAVFAFAGTTPERAHETLSVMLEVLRSAGDGISSEELARAKVNLKSSLIISEESPGSRSSSNASDWWLIKKVRPLDEIARAIDAVDDTQICAYLKEFPSESFMMVTLGAKNPFEGKSS